MMAREDSTCVTCWCMFVLRPTVVLAERVRVVERQTTLDGGERRRKEVGVGCGTLCLRQWCCGMGKHMLCAVSVLSLVSVLR